MPRFYFHTADGERTIDRTGTMVDTYDAAKLIAVERAGAWIRQEPSVMLSSRDCRVEVTDERNALRFTVMMFCVEAGTFGVAG